MSDTSVKIEKDGKAAAEHVDLCELEVIGASAAQEDHEQTVYQAIAQYPTAILWCAYAIWVLALSSYDNQAGGVFLAIPQFRKDFGFPFDGNYVLPAKWQSAYSGGPTASSVISYHLFA